MSSSELGTKSARRERKTGKLHAIFGTLVGTLVFAVILWFLFAGRISYAASQCSKGPKQCAVGVAVALGIVDVYDKNGHCTGSGCNF